MLYDSSSVTMARYEWFNEAVTEWLALRLSRFNNGQNDSFSSFKGSTKYTKERRWLDDLFLLGLEEEFVIRALFENIDQDDDASLEKSEFFVKLKQRVGELKRDPEAFERLDNQFKLESFTRLLPWPVQEKDHGLNYNTSLPNGTRVFDLSLRFGSEKSTASRDMIISLWPDNDGYSSEDKYVQITQALDDLVKKYPSFIYTISKPFTVNNPRFEL